MSSDPTRLVNESAPRLTALRQAMAAVVVGQKDLVDGLLIGLFCQGHVLIEGLHSTKKQAGSDSFDEIDEEQLFAREKLLLKNLKTLFLILSGLLLKRALRAKAQPLLRRAR